MGSYGPWAGHFRIAFTLAFLRGAGMEGVPVAGSMLSYLARTGEVL